MTEKEFKRIDGFVSAVAYSSLVIGLFVFIDYLGLLKENDLTQFGKDWSLVIFGVGIALFAILQTLRVRAYYKRYAGVK